MQAEKEIILEAFKPSAENVAISGRHFVDDLGRVLDLRGANVSSSNKVTLSHSNARRYKELNKRVRITVTWEALEHAGPGQYDQEYLDYLKELLTGMGEEGIVAYVDVFSRYCGGSGAPGWVVEAAGFDLSDDGEKLVLSDSAFLDGIRGGRLQGERGLWPTGYQKLACATMNTLFWGGETFAPAFKVSGEDGKKVNIQTYLQDAFLKVIDELVDAVGDLPGVLGFELMNEPHPGFIGMATLNEWNYDTDLHLGQVPSPLQSFSMGAGHPTPNIPVYTRSFPFPTRHTSSTTGNPTGTVVWRADGPTNGECPFEREGVWRWSEQKKTAVALQVDYFSKDRKGRKINFYQDFYFPFVRKWNETIAKRQPGKCRMVEAVPNEFCPEWPGDARPGHLVYAPHWYDLYSMFQKSFGFMTVNVQGLSRGMFVLKALYFGRDGAKKNYALQIRNLVEKAREKLGEVPIVFGECGVPIDMNNENAFYTGDFRQQETMMDSLISAMDASLVHFNLWTYNPANRDDIGCDWNAEHFSWYSNHRRDQVLQYKRENDMPGTTAEEDLDAGARLLNVIVRPYAVATAGTPLSLSYIQQTSEYTYRFRSPYAPASTPEDQTSTTPPSTAQLTEIFLPRRIYPKNITKHIISAGGRIYFDWENERAWVWFVDSPISPDGRSVSVSTKERTRRVDIYIGIRQEKLWRWWQILPLIILWVSAIRLAMWWQERDWENVRKMGVEPWAGFNWSALTSFKPWEILDKSVERRL